MKPPADQSHGHPAPKEAPILAAAEVLDFWFSLKKPGKKDDRRVRRTLGTTYQRAAEGRLEDWAETPRGRLALVLLLDQVPRHLFREQPRSYAGDEKAQGLTGRFFDQEDWEGFSPLEKYYAVMPWLHAEQRENQERVNPVIHALAREIPDLAFMGEIADLYRETIARFGRFPHRNALLGRSSSEEERKFLEEVWFPRRREIQRTRRRASG